MRRQAWISDTSNKKVKQIKQSFQTNLAEQAKESRINYYDFLLVAKKLAFRFEESSHLMALKNFFSKNKNSIVIKKLVDALVINQQSLNTKDDKVIVKFNVPDNDFAPIKEVTNEDEQEFYEEDESLEDDVTKFNKVGSDISVNQNNQQINQKMTIILSIKLQEMQKKLKLLTDPFHYPNIFTIFDDYPHEEISYQKFKSGILEVISDIRDKIKLSEDDIKMLFHLLNNQQKGFVKIDDIQKLKNIQDLNQAMKQFYFARINRSMVKNTLFKLGKVKNSSIQIYQLKNASVLQFQQIEDSIVNEPINKSSSKKRIPHFGPLKGANRFKKNDKHYNSNDIKHTYSHSNVNSSKKGSQLDKQREKIEKILRSSKQSKKRSKNGDTVASKLRSLFIHKVILPREKMLEEEKQKYGRAKANDYQLSIRPLREV